MTNDATMLYPSVCTEVLQHGDLSEIAKRLTKRCR